jgi:hypothetical protein
MPYLYGDEKNNQMMAEFQAFALIKPFKYLFFLAKSPNFVPQNPAQNRLIKPA